MMLALIGAFAAIWAALESLARRLPRLEPTCRRLVRARTCLARITAATPGTTIYLAVLIVTITEQAQLSTRLATAIARRSSTNVYLLTSRPLDVLTTSAFWLDNPGIGSVALLAQFVVVLVLLEATLGTGRWLITIVAGHVGASLIVGFGLWFAIRHHWIDARIARTTDVGISYGLTAATVTLILGLRGRVRLVLLALTVARLGLGVARTSSFTDVGHILAGLFGAVAYLAFKRPHLHPATFWADVTATPVTHGT